MCGLGRALFCESQQDVWINQLADELAGIDTESLTTAIYDTSSEADMSFTKEEAHRIAGFFQQVALNGNPLTKTFSVLVAFYLSDTVRRKVSGDTSVLLAKPYFDDFENRLHLYLCGSKSLSALLPVEIVLREWQLYAKLVTR